jgi:phosphoribosylamine--glycine ligase
MLRLEGDLLPALRAACEGRLRDVALRWRAAHSLVVVMAAEGYPGTPVRGTEIRGLDHAAAVPGAVVFHAGTARRADGALIANGGRVLGVGGTGATLRAARNVAYEAVEKVEWAGGFCRRDIGWRAL